MLTPRFKLSQDENHVFITIHAPYTNIGDTEIDVDGENFLFVSSPYFLRLRLPGKIVENDKSKGSYVCDSGDFNLTFDKDSPGEHFENLEMITSLLAPRDIPDINPSLVELLEEDGITIEDREVDDDSKKYAFGFANKITTEFVNIGSEFPQIFELRVPEQVALDERHVLRIQHEDDKFSSDHYLADLYDDELLAPYLTAVPFWEASDFNKNAEFTDDEVAILKELPNKHYLLNKTEYRQVLFGLVDILYGYCYDKRTTLNESTVESSWTINKLSSTFSWFCVFKDIKHVLIACFRRALIYPIFRNFELCKKVRNDVVSLLKKGKKFLIKCVLEIHQMFNSSSDARYILNQLYIKDYLVFLQKCRNEEFDELYNNIINIDVTKKDLDLELEELEAAAELVQKEETDVLENEMAVRMASMTLLPGVRRSNGPYLEESDDESNTSSSDSSSNSSDESSDLDSDDDPS
ncbi:protein SHQ1 homolog [Pectinophora gossypiella]|uniref:protein SHQ1 homolog n=1 Tax=Pectinophora gossypiella TaxID=13191 RepID=UPI00214EE1AC|nr:protein SHQ1 homolog [Pectinophora gossypiella]